jgi:hypothetical protein
LRANGSRECAPDDKLREAIHLSACRAMDCFVASAPRNDGDVSPRNPSNYLILRSFSSSIPHRGKQNRFR